VDITSNTFVSAQRLPDRTVFSAINRRLFEKRLIVSHVGNEVTSDVFQKNTLEVCFVNYLDLRVSPTVYTHNAIVGYLVTSF
jgi:hypothetical protein